VRSKGPDRTERFLVILFRECTRQLETEPLNQVAEDLIHNLDDLSPADRRLAISAMRRICKDLGARIKVSTTEDVQRLILSASYWSHSTEAFAKEMSFDEDARDQRWMKVESLAQASKDDVFKVVGYFEGLSLD